MEFQDLLLAIIIVIILFWYFNIRGTTKCITYNSNCLELKYTRQKV